MSAERDRRRTARSLVVLATAAACVPVGVAIGGNEFDSSPQAVPASECPQSNAAFQKVGLPSPDEYAPSCPTEDEVLHLIEASSVPAEDPALTEAFENHSLGEESSGNLDQLPEFEQEFQHETGDSPSPD